MEVILFHRHGKKNKSPFAKPLQDLTAIVAPAQLLAEGKRPALIKNMREASALDASRFDSVCLSLINNVINHVQRMPETSNSYYSQPGGLLDHALNRTEAALSIFRQFVVQDEGVELSEEQKLWLYALFSAGMLQGIGKLQLDYHVDLFDLNGQLLKPWSPLLENMASIGAYYHFERLPEGEHDLRCRLNILLARLLMPASGFAWIISNPQVLATWLALLSEDARGAGTLGAILIRADAIAIQRYLNEIMAKGIGQRSGRPNRMNTFVDNVPESVADKERMLGIEFLKWLTEQLKSGDIKINEGSLLMVPGALLLTVETFKKFVANHPEFAAWQAVQNAFLSLGLHRVGMDGAVLSRFEQVHTQQMHKGIVLADFAVILPAKVQLHHVHTGVVSTVSATELVHLALNNHDFNPQKNHTHLSSLNSLSVSGEWQAVEKNNKSLTAGKTRSG